MSVRTSEWTLQGWNIYSAIIGFASASAVTLIVTSVFIWALYVKVRSVNRIHYTQYLSIVTLITMLVLINWGLPNMMGLWISWKWSCPYPLFFQWTLLFTYRSFLSSLYVARLQLIYKGTAFEYKYWIKILYTTIIMHWVILVFISFYEMFIGMRAIVVKFEGTNIEQCGGDAPEYALLLFTVFELIFPIITMILFINPVCKMWTITDDYELYNMAVKYSIITCTAIISTIVGAVSFGYFNLLLPAAIDLIINANCILLYETWANKYYQYICCPLYHLLHKSTLASELSIVVSNSAKPKCIETNG